eukprot:Phypoly_transcript_26695.p1 GENE.Phypoly_transcript_26695~~Phypoly_transcript_26695.p1  ORF type:complete len:118 (+),score=17.76 Phypoly_transcript_26695:44-355(+)
MAKVGGMKEVKPIDADATAIASHVKADVESKAGKSFGTYEPVSYATQLVNGVNYFIKVKVGDDEAVHVRAHKGFQDPHPTLHSIQSGKKVSDDLELLLVLYIK